jgi:hypothetical protein
VSRTLVGLGLLAASVHAEVRCIVEPDAAATPIKVTRELEAQPGPLELEMPDGSPGDRVDAAAGAPQKLAQRQVWYHGAIAK